MQDHLQAALSQLANEPTEVTAAGRTDTGVHASAQVVHFDTQAVRDQTSWVRGTNSNLHAAARVQWACEVSGEFHARFSAVSRTYRYLLVDAGVAPAILRDRVGWYHKSLDVAAMVKASAALKGEHDFSSFRDAQCQAKSPVRDLKDVQVERRGNVIVLTFRANAFLHHMIRNIVGSLVYVGAGKQKPEWIGELLAMRDRREAAPTFAAGGLYLAGVEYDRSFGLPAFRIQPLITLP